MARIFISYSKQNPEPTRALAAFLEGEGFTVWWDTNLVGGETFRAVIDRELDAAAAVIVIWTPQSVTSEWVISEADHADAQKKLIPVAAGGVEFKRIPKPYTTRHTDLIENRAAILNAIRRVVGDQPPASFASPTDAPAPVSSASPSAAAFADIETELDPAEYELFVKHWPGTSEAAEAGARAGVLTSWNAVDKSDPTAIEGFDCPAGFAALQSVVSAALEAAQATRRRAWEAEREARRKAREHAEQEERRWGDLLAKLGAGADGGFREALRSGGRGPEMVALRGGVFTMGSHENESEKPAHEVNVAPFAIGRTAVTFEAYDAFCAARGAQKPSDEGWGRESRPAINLSCEDAQAFCEWLSEETGAGYRLPSEAEWEFACRAGSTTRFSFGDDEGALGDHAWFSGNAVYKTHPVGEKRPNAFGLFDMHGNVWEWCQDAWNKTYAGAPSNGSAWMSGDTSRAVLRGGSWYGYTDDLRSATRFRDQRGSRYVIIGFRVVRTLVE